MVVLASHQYELKEERLTNISSLSSKVVFDRMLTTGGGVSFLAEYFILTLLGPFYHMYLLFSHKY